MTQDGGMLSTKQEEDLCGCCAYVQTLWVWIRARAKWPDYYWWVHVKDIKADGKTLGPVGSGVVDFKTVFAHIASSEKTWRIKLQRWTK